MTRSVQNQLGADPAVVVDIAEKIADGDLSVAFEGVGKTETGVLLAMKQMTAKLNEVLNETSKLNTLVQAGRLDVRGDVEAFSGGWRDLVVGVNNIIDAFVAPILMTGASLDRISRGDIPDLITEKYQGDFNTIKANLNTLISTMNQITGLAENIAAGNLSVEVQTRSDQDRLMQALNVMVQNLNEATLAAKEMAAGNLAVKVQERSDDDILMQALNAMIQRFNGIVTDVRTAADNMASGSQGMSSSST